MSESLSILAAAGQTEGNEKPDSRWDSWLDSLKQRSLDLNSTASTRVHMLELQPTQP